MVEESEIHKQLQAELDEVAAEYALVESPGQHDAEVEIGFTKSMGEGTYEFLRLDIRHRGRLEDDEDLNGLTDRLYKNLEEKIVEKVNDLDMALGPRGRASKIHDNRK